MLSKTITFLGGKTITARQKIELHDRQNEQVNNLEISRQRYRSMTSLELKTAVSKSNAREEIERTGMKLHEREKYCQFVNNVLPTYVFVSFTTYGSTIIKLIIASAKFLWNMDATFVDDFHEVSDDDIDDEPVTRSAHSCTKEEWEETETEFCSVAKALIFRKIVQSDGRLSYSSSLKGSMT